MYAVILKSNLQNGQQYYKLLLLRSQIGYYKTSPNVESKSTFRFSLKTISFCVGRRGLMDRASAFYPHGVKGLGLKPPWRQKL